MAANTPTSKLLQAGFICITLLTLSLLLSGFIQFALIQKSAGAFTRAVDNEIPALNSLQSLTQSGANFHRCIISALIPGDESEISDWRVRATLSNEKYQYYLKQLDRLLSDPSLHAELVQLQESHKTYELAGWKLIDLLLEGKREEALHFRVQELRPAFENCQTLENRLGDSIQRYATEELDSLTKEVRLIQTVLVILTTWPLIATLLAICVMFAYILWLWRKIPNESSLH